MSQDLMTDLRKALKRVRNPVLRERFTQLAKKLAPKGGPVNTKEVHNLIRVIERTNR